MQSSQLAQYIPVLFLLAAAVGFAVGTLLISVLLGKFAPHTKAKDTAYECGKDPIGSNTARFSVKFYLVAMLFILFDIEVVFMYPWARGSVCGLMTTLGGIGHTLPYLISNVKTATTIAIGVVLVELCLISWIRHRFMDSPWVSALFQVVLGGILVFLAGILIGKS